MFVFKRISLLALLLFAMMLGTVAQEMSVKSFEYLPNDITARTSPRNDRNDKPCAVIRVGIALQGVVFDGNTIGKPVYNTGEYLVYLTSGSRQLTIHHDSYLPLVVSFADYGIDRVESSNTYRLTVLTGGGVPADQQSKGNFLTMSVSPPTSRVRIDEGDATTVNPDGTFKTFLKNGNHRYTVEAEGYLPQSGTLSMTGARQHLKVDLQSVKASLTVRSTTAGSKIYINEDYKGSDQWQGELTPGTYLVEARKDGCRSASTTVTLSKQQTETVTLPALQQISGSLMVDYEPVDADVYLDNHLLGKTPNVFTSIATGNHAIKISKAGYADYTGSVTIEENQQASISGSLTKNEWQNESKNADSLRYQSPRKIKMIIRDSKDFLIGAGVYLDRNGRRVGVTICNNIEGRIDMSLQNGDIIRVTYNGYESKDIHINDVNSLKYRQNKITLRKGLLKKTVYMMIFED